jgi:hypothetical protein
MPITELNLDLTDEQKALRDAGSGARPPSSSTGFPTPRT